MCSTDGFSSNYNLLVSDETRKAILDRCRVEINPATGRPAYSSIAKELKISRQTVYDVYGIDLILSDSDYSDTEYATLLGCSSTEPIRRLKRIIGYE